MLKKFRNDESGLTLIELMIVIVILGIMAAVIAPRIMDAPQKANVSKAKIEIEAISTALNLYAIDVGQYPTTEQGLDALWRAPNPAPPNWTGPYSDHEITNDPWGNPYVYVTPSNNYGYRYDLISYGKDGKLGGSDYDADITNFKSEGTTD